MNDLSAEHKALANYKPTHKVRFVTATMAPSSLGAAVIHLGNNRSVDEVVTAAQQEEAQGIAVSSHQGGHVEYFKYRVELPKVPKYPAATVCKPGQQIADARAVIAAAPTRKHAILQQYL